MGTITVNGQTFFGSNITISNGKIMVDGKDLTPDSKEIIIHVNGDIDEIKADSCSKISVSGNARNIATASGDIDVTGDVTGNIQTMSGNVDCGTVGGSISTMSGNVKHKK